GFCFGRPAVCWPRESRRMSSCCKDVAACDGFICCIGCLSLVPGLVRRVVNQVAFFPPRPPGYHVSEDKQVFLIESDYGLSPLPDLAPEGIVVDTVRMWTRRGNVIMGFHFKRADSKRTLLFSHGNSTDIGIMFQHLRDLCSRLQCDIFVSLASKDFTRREIVLLMSPITSSFA
ncbi:unnamed protein product, partial [Polarella glacialis]